MSNIECRYLSELNVNDKYFDSLKEDYYNFNDWFKKKQDNNTMCYVTMNNGNITSLLILKIEYEDEDYSNFTIPFNKSKRLKICTFKVINKGKGIGEEFIINREAIINNVNAIDVTIFDKYQSLIKLFNNNGYYEYTNKKTWSDSDSFDFESMLVKKVR